MEHIDVSHTLNCVKPPEQLKHERVKYTPPKFKDVIIHRCPNRR